MLALKHCVFLATWLILFMGQLAHGKDRADHSAAGVTDGEYCQLETFSASCEEKRGTVVVMERAEYGRMAIGKCVKENYGAMPCSTDVLDRVDRLCSGRPRCSFLVGVLHGSQPCPADLSAYMKARHHCQSVETGPRASCLAGAPIRVSAYPTGYLANSVTMETNKGSSNCPWVIEGQPGQQINITLINFARIPEGGKDVADRNTRPRICYQYMTLRDSDYVKTVTECEGEPRESMVFTSSTHRVTLEVLTRKTSDVYFLIRYDVFGCTDPEPAYGTWTKRMSSQLMVHCNSSGEQWTLTCRNNVWEGTPGNCTPPAGGTSLTLGKAFDETLATFPYGILVVVAVGVALGVFLGGILLICASRYYKRARGQAHQTAHTEQPPTYWTSPNWSHTLPPTLGRSNNNKEGVAAGQQTCQHSSIPQTL